jgi:hypothetical protein
MRLGSWLEVDRLIIQILKVKGREKSSPINYEWATSFQVGKLFPYLRFYSCSATSCCVPLNNNFKYYHNSKYFHDKNEREKFSRRFAKHLERNRDLKSLLRSIICECTRVERSWSELTSNWSLSLRVSNDFYLLRVTRFFWNFYRVLLGIKKLKSIKSCFLKIPINFNKKFTNFPFNSKSN